MKNLLIRKLALILLYGTALATGAGEVSVADPRFSEIQNTTILPYYEAMQKGEVGSLRDYLSDRRYAANRTLIEQNATYPDYLRRQFRGAAFHVLRITEDNNQLTALVKIYWPDGRESQTPLVLIEDVSTLPSNSIRWRIDRD